MLDLKRIRNNPEEIKKALSNRGEDFDTAVIDEDYLKEQLIQQLKFKINDLIDASQIDNILTSINNNLVYTNIEVSNNGNNYYDFIRNTNINYIFSLSTENINITINS